MGISDEPAGERLGMIGSLPLSFILNWINNFPFESSKFYNRGEILIINYFNSNGKIELSKILKGT